MQRWLIAQFGIVYTYVLKQMCICISTVGRVKFGINFTSCCENAIKFHKEPSAILSFSLRVKFNTTISLVPVVSQVNTIAKLLLC